MTHISKLGRSFPTPTGCPIFGKTISFHLSRIVILPRLSILLTMFSLNFSHKTSSFQVYIVSRVVECLRLSYASPDQVSIWRFSRHHPASTFPSANLNSPTLIKMSSSLRMASGILGRATRNLASIEATPSHRILPALRNTSQPQCRAYTQAQRPQYTHNVQCAFAARNNFSTTAFRSRAKTMGQLRQRNSTGPFSWKAALLFVLTGAGMMIYFRVEKARLERKRIAEMSKGVGRPKVGGPFVLKDLDGKEFTEEDLKGKYSFVSPLLDFRLTAVEIGANMVLLVVIGLLRFHSLP